MATCPQFPPVPAEVLARFSKMREWDSKLRKYGTELCAVVSGSTVDLTPINDLLAEIQSDVLGLQQQIDDCCDDTPEATIPADLWDMGYVTDVAGTIIELGDGTPLDEIFDMAA